MVPTFSFDGVDYDLDEHGHLARPEQWSGRLAAAMAEHDGIALRAEHWWLIEFVRNYHQTYGTPPLMRVLIKAFRAHLGDDGVGSRDLYRLFSDSPVRQACKYGGLPAPQWCI